MAFSSSNAGQGGTFGSQAASAAQPTAQDGPELKEIQTNQIGFQSINGEAKLKLLPSPWPLDALPPPSASLLTVASSKGILAASGPEGVVVIRTESVRKATCAIPKAVDPQDNIRPVDPDLELPVPRASHVVFSVDESVLVVSPQDGGGLIAYQVEGLLKGEIQPALQIATNNTGLRSLVANPSPESAELFAAITTNGELLMADFKSGGLRNGTNGAVLRTGVICLSWSNRGKQLVAGLEDGRAVQITPDGAVTADIPKPPTLAEKMHVSAMSWLENDTFFIIYTPNDSITDGMAPPSDYYIVSRQPKTTNFAFQKLPEVVSSFGMDRQPSFQFITRLRNFKPHLQDLLMVASTTSADIGTVTRADAPLSKDEPVVGDFTLTSSTDDSRRAILPLSMIEGDTWPIGLAVDLSSKDNIVHPIPGDDEIFESATPVPSLLVLNHEGLLISWWVVYADSIREKTAYTGLIIAGGSSQTTQSQPQTPDLATTQSMTPPKPAIPPSTGFGQPAFGKPGFGTTTPASPGFGQPGFGKPGFGSAGPFAKSTVSPFGAPSSTPSFGSTSPSFGTPSNFGSAKPSWTNTGFDSAKPQPGGSGFGEPAFGTATPLGGTTAPAFGSSTGLGARPSPFGQPAVSSTPTNTTTPAFRQPPSLGPRPGTPFGSGPSKSPFTSLPSNENKPSGFTQFSGSRGFSDLKSDQSAGGSPFVKAGGDLALEPSGFGNKPANGFGFENARPSQEGSALGEGVTDFKLGSLFKGDDTAKYDLPKPGDEGNFTFGGGLGDLLGETKKALSPTHDREADMNDSDVLGDKTIEQGQNQLTTASSQAPEGSPSLVTPPSTVMHSKATHAPPLSNIFGTSTNLDATPTVAETNKAAPAVESDVKTPSSTATVFGTSTQPNTTPASIQNSKPGWSVDHISSTTPKESPVPKTLPFSTAAKSGEQAPKIKAEPPSDDDTQDLSAIPEAPLPPDPTSKASYTAGDTSVSSINSKSSPDDAPLPPDFLPSRTTNNLDPDEAELPEDKDCTSEYESSVEDASPDISPIEDPSEHTEQIHTSPESSSGRGGDNTQDLSLTGGLFTKVMCVDPSQKQSRPLFGEIGGPVFLPPKPQESPRSPSPIRHLLPNDLLRPEAPRSVSAPSRPSAIGIRRAELSKISPANQKLPSDGVRQKEEERLAAAAKAKARAEAEESLQLEDDEDERLRAELARPVSPSHQLARFLHHEQGNFDDGTKSGIPGQIERLYQDINAMIDTLGINARSLTAFMLYQQSQELNEDWPGVLNSATPLDSLNDDWVLSDIMRLHEGADVLQTLLDANKLEDVATTLQQCQSLLGKDLFQLKNKLISMRKVVHAWSDSDIVFNAPLSAEQASLQHDLRKSSTSMQTKLMQAEHNLAMLRAKLAEVSPAPSGNVNGASKASIPRISSQKKPTVEAVTNTIAKMTSMAEKKSADIDVLEAQLRKMGLGGGGSVNASRQTSVEPNGTPHRAGEKMSSSALIRTPASAAGSVYHTPDSKLGNSTRATPDTGRKRMRASLAQMSSSVSTEDKSRWREKARRRKEVENVLKEVLAERRKKRGRAETAS